MTSRRLQSAFAVIVAALGIASCGDGTNEPEEGLPATAALVGPKAIAATAPGSPKRAFMLWWRSLQYADIQGYNRRLSSTLRTRPGHAQRARLQVAAMAGQVLNVYPHIMRVEAREGRAMLYVELEVRTLVGAERYTSTRVPRAFPMVRNDGDWQIDDDLFVETGARSELQKLAADDARAGTGRSSTEADASPSLPLVPAPDVASPRSRTQTTPRAPARQPATGLTTTTTTATQPAAP